MVVDTDTIGVGVQWSENSNSDDFSKNLIRARCEGRVHILPVSHRLHSAPRWAAARDGKIDLLGCHDCDICAGWVPNFVDSPSSTPGTLASGRCPHHGTLRAV